MIEVYIGSEKLDLFNDEDININLSIQNIKDISKIYTDYTQNFSVPASRINNAIFKHYYNADISGGFDSALRKSATLVVDKEPFRSGAIELISVNMKNGSPDSYNIVFFSAGVSLKDTFGDDKLNDLDLSAYDHEYIGSNVRTGLEAGLFSGNVIYPLISPVKDWYYDSTSTAHNTNNIAYHGAGDNHGVNYYELKPAIRVSSIIDAIEAKYGITFNSTFFASDKITNLYMWCHRREGYIFKDQDNGWIPSSIRWYGYQTGSSALAVDSAGWRVGSATLSVDLTYNYSTTADAGVYIFVNGNQFAVRNYAAGTGSDTIEIYGLKLNDFVEIKYGPAQGSAGASFDLTLTNVEFFRVTFPTAVVGTASTGGTLLNFNNEVVISDHLPEQKINDFINGLIKMFNLTLEPVSATSFNIEPLDDWYASGSTYDITKYTDIESHQVSKPELYRRISFKYQLADSRAMRNHRLQNGGVGYGDLRADFTFDGSELITENTFELLRWDKFVDTNTGASVNFIAGKSLDINLEPYIGEPILFYSNDVLDVSANLIGFVDESGVTTGATANIVFCANVDNQTSGDVTQMLTYGLEIDPFHEQSFTTTLYGEYWNDYVTDLYSTSRRVYQFKAILPVTIMNQLKMNDKLIISGKQYIINQVKLNLRTREAQLELLNDV